MLFALCGWEQKRPPTTERGPEVQKTNGNAAMAKPKIVAKASKMEIHNRIKYRYEITKFATGCYGCELGIFYPSRLGGNEIFDSESLQKMLNCGLPFAANPAKNGFVQKFAQGHIDAIVEKYNNGEEIPMTFKPKTNPTSAQLKAMRDECERLVATFSVPGVAKIGGESLSRAMVQEWKTRGRVSAHWANILCKNKLIRDAGFTRESLRPDVPFWYVD